MIQTNDTRILPLKDIKDSVLEMMDLVKGQIERTRKAIFEFDHDIAEQVKSVEKKINALDLKIDKDSERAIALYNPVAVDLRFIISTLKMNTFIERIGDNTRGICKYVLDCNGPIDKDLLEELKLAEQFDILEKMMDLIIEAYQTEDTKTASQILSLDKKVDELNKLGLDIIASHIQKNPAQARALVLLHAMLVKTERLGDLTKNLAEEIIFFVDAKVLKHKKKKAEKYIQSHTEE